MKEYVKNYEGGKGTPKVGMPFHLLQISVYAGIHFCKNVTVKHLSKE